MPSSPSSSSLSSFRRLVGALRCGSADSAPSTRRNKSGVSRVRTHPGEVLNAEFMVPLGLGARRLAKQIGVPPNRITEIIRGRRDLSADTALRLSRCFGTTAQFWLNLQDAHELSKAEATRDYTGIKA